MQKHSRCLLFLMTGILIISVWGCNYSAGKKAKETDEVSYGSYQDNIKGMVGIRTFDHYNRALKNGYGFFVAPNLVVTNLDWLKGAYKAEIAPVGTRDMTDVVGFTAYDHNLNLVVLEVKRDNSDYIKVRGSLIQPDTLYILKRPKRKLFVVKAPAAEYQDLDSVGFWPVPSELKEGNPAFRLNHEFMGIVQERVVEDSLQKVVLSRKWIAQLLKEQSKRPVSIYDLRTKTDKVYISHQKIAGFRIKTTMGDIVIRMHDETPEYRDNFIKLVSDQFYDSLLVHRVLSDFLIQMGAADSRNADKDDVVGWQGPGYTLPTKIIPALFHKRGAVAASKLPAARNPRNRSDGSQFFIIAGRVFTNEELDDIEKGKGFRFTHSQRQIYTTIGGAPYLDGDYTVFGEVVSGMNVVDKIAGVKTYGEDRPVEDIRIKTIEILKK